MIDHICIDVSEYERSRAFYVKALEPLGYSVIMEFEIENGVKVLGLGTSPKPEFWIMGPRQVAFKHNVHLALQASTRSHVDEFYKAAMANGGTDNGAPGLRPEYHQA